MHSLIITAHPSSQGFTHAIAQRYREKGDFSLGSFYWLIGNPLRVILGLDPGIQSIPVILGQVRNIA